MISIAMATYNGEKYLRIQLDSILNQTLKFDELIICDDNSSDDTSKILKDYADLDKRINVILNNKTLGFKRNFEKAISLCNGDYIALCDQDDIWLPNHLKILYENIGENNLICGGSIIINSKGENQNIFFHNIQNYDFKGEIHNTKTLYFLSYYHGPFQGASMLMKKNFIKTILPIGKDIRFHDVWAVYVACLFSSFRFIPIPVTYYRLHENNVSGKYRKRLRLKTLLGHLFTNRLKRYRLPMIKEARKRYFNQLPLESQSLLAESELYMKRSESINGRILNLLYEMKHFDSIYGIK